jgi:hypothetical protein
VQGDGSECSTLPGANYSVCGCRVAACGAGSLGADAIRALHARVLHERVSHSSHLDLRGFHIVLIIHCGPFVKAQLGF